MSAGVPLPTVVFVLGKGGVGRTTVSAALGAMWAARGERVLVLEWAVAEAIAPWFGLAAQTPAPWRWIPKPREVTPGLSVLNYRLDEALRGYFVDHLGLSFFYRHVIENEHLQRLIQAAPGLAELLFVGQVWWLTHLAPTEAGLAFDRILVDAPATGHGASLLDLPAAAATIGASGLLKLELERVQKMMDDARSVGAVVVTLPEELAVEETLELVPRATRELHRRPLAAFVNRSVAGVLPDSPAALAALAALDVPAAAREALEGVHAELRGRARLEAALRDRLAGATDLGVFSLPELLAVRGACTPREVVQALAPTLGAQLEVAS